MKKMVGECKRCGWCCVIFSPNCVDRKLFFDECGIATCAVYDKRHPGCRNFPTEEELNTLKELGCDCGYEIIDSDI